MLTKFSCFILLLVWVVGQTAPLYDEDDTDNQGKPLTNEQFSELEEYLSRRFNEDSVLKELDRNTRYPNQHSMAKRDALWTTTEVLDCVQRLKLFKNSSKLDLVTEMLNCYRRLKHQG